MIFLWILFLWSFICVRADFPCEPFDNRTMSCCLLNCFGPTECNSLCPDGLLMFRTVNITNPCNITDSNFTLCIYTSTTANDYENVTCNCSHSNYVTDSVFSNYESTTIDHESSAENTNEPNLHNASEVGLPHIFVVYILSGTCGIFVMLSLIFLLCCIRWRQRYFKSKKTGREKAGSEVQKSNKAIKTDLTEQNFYDDMQEISTDVTEMRRYPDTERVDSPIKDTPRITYCQIGEVQGPSASTTSGLLTTDIRENQEYAMIQTENNIYDEAVTMVTDQTKKKSDTKKGKRSLFKKNNDKKNEGKSTKTKGKRKDKDEQTIDRSTTCPNDYGELPTIATLSNVEENRSDDLQAYMGMEFASKSVFNQETWNSHANTNKNLMPNDEQTRIENPLQAYMEMESVSRPVLKQVEPNRSPNANTNKNHMPNSITNLPTSQLSTFEQSTYESMTMDCSKDQKVPQTDANETLNRPLNDGKGLPKIKNAKKLQHEKYDHIDAVVSLRMPRVEIDENKYESMAKMPVLVQRDNPCDVYDGTFPTSKPSDTEIKSPSILNVRPDDKVASCVYDDAISVQKCRNNQQTDRLTFLNNKPINQSDDLKVTMTPNSNAPFSVHSSSDLTSSGVGLFIPNESTSSVYNHRHTTRRSSGSYDVIQDNLDDLQQGKETHGEPDDDSSTVCFTNEDKRHAKLDKKQPKSPLQNCNSFREKLNHQLKKIDNDNI